MTSEIAIMNRSAVALAADSAVTIDSPTGPKVYESANKLFVLRKGQPVGVMVYDSSDHMGVPWETIIKAYRMSRRDANGFDYLSNYADDFLEFVSSDKDVVPPELESFFIRDFTIRRVKEIFEPVADLAESHLDSIGREMTIAKQRKCVSAMIDEQVKLWTSLRDGLWLGSIDESRLLRNFTALIESIIDEQARVWRNIPITRIHRARIRTLMFNALRKVPVTDGEALLDLRSGVVIAGFGRRDFFPRLTSIELFGAIDGALRHAKGDQEEVISTDHQSAVVPFAQRDMVDGFINGINSRFLEQFGDCLLEQVATLPDRIVDLLSHYVPAASADVVDGIRAATSSSARFAFVELTQEINRLKFEHSRPVEDSVAFLPKDELASMAESLVNLTSLKRRVSLHEPQTVGGPIDVAVISRGDGFVWIRRKHYFKQELNPTWATLHAEG
jgi:hypothetical protein